MTVPTCIVLQAAKPGEMKKEGFKKVTSQRGPFSGWLFRIHGSILLPQTKESNRTELFKSTMFFFNIGIVQNAEGFRLPDQVQATEYLFLFFFFFLLWLSHLKVSIVRARVGVSKCASLSPRPWMVAEE